MDDKEFDALVRRIEAGAASSSSYAMRVALIGALGYVYIGAVLLVLLGVSAALIVVMWNGHAGALIKIAWIPIAAALYVIKALWVKFDAPQGRPLTRADAPELFAEAESLAAALRAPKPDVVLISDDFNASVSQVPRFGIFGGSTNYLTVGVPLMASIPTAQFRAVLAHEFAHLSSAHGKVGSWIYRVRMTWLQLAAALKRDQHWSAAIYSRFLQWYVPYFSAYAFVLIRQHEYEADALAAGVVGTPQMAQALVDIETRGLFLAESFWPSVWKQTLDSPTPPAETYSALRASMQSAMATDSSRRFLPHVLRRESETNDTHPSLRERLEALVSAKAADVAPTASFSESAVDHFVAPAVAAEMNEQWAADVARPWAERHEALRVARVGLAAAATKDLDAMDVDERYELASWREDIEGDDAGREAYRALMDKYPAFAPARFAFARLLLASGDDAGLGHLRTVMDAEPQAIVPACNLALAFLSKAGRTAEMAEFMSRGTGRAVEMEAANEERGTIRPKDKFVESEVPRELLAPLISALDKEVRVRWAYLARKQVGHLADEAPMHLVAVCLRWPMFMPVSMKTMQEARLRLEQSLPMPPDVHLFVLTPDHEDLRKKIKKAKNSVFYDSGRRKAERLAAANS